MLGRCERNRRKRAIQRLANEQKHDEKIDRRPEAAKELTGTKREKWAKLKEFRERNASKKRRTKEFLREREGTQGSPR